MAAADREAQTRLVFPAAGDGPADTERGDDHGDGRAPQRVPRGQSPAGGTGAPVCGADAGDQGDDRGGGGGRDAWGADRAVARLPVRAVLGGGVVRCGQPDGGRVQVEAALGDTVGLVLLR